ncbi:MAG: sugar O-acetyltransferase, partial [Rikenellaceae bacterium]|nr:sugar O-acetyltransferase [Rikenellaceae bacterium]
RELIDRWHYAKELLRTYSATDTRDRGALSAILDELLGSKGENVWIAAPFHVDYGENIYIGDNVEINMNCVFLDCNRIEIGNNTGIGPAVQIYAVGHPVDPLDRLTGNPAGDLAAWNSLTAPVTIGDNVWIGGGSIILPGVTIGDGTTIGAGSVVTRTIPAGCLAVGNPCKIIRRLL